ncbi:hypothetical protein [Yersinia enterocolitica]|uniref:hypothetical protein n=1 Tax=Yersinia enterocolitica TaxID=630 RepID=UPI003CFD5BFE
MNINILGVKTSPAARSLFRAEWQKNKMWVVAYITANFMKTLFFMALMVLVSIGLSLCMLALIGDFPMSQRYQAFEAYMDIIDIISQDSVGWTGVTVVIAAAMTALMTFHHFYLAAELGYTSLVSYRTAHNPVMKLFIKRAQHHSGMVVPTGLTGGKGIQPQSVTERMKRIYGADAVRDGISSTSDKTSGNEK